MSFLGRSMMCPTDARTSKPLPRYFSIVFALAGDSTITSDLLIAILYYYRSFCFVSTPTHSIPSGLLDSQSANSVFIAATIRNDSRAELQAHRKKSNHEIWKLPRNTARFPPRRRIFRASRHYPEYARSPSAAQKRHKIN